MKYLYMTGILLSLFFLQSCEKDLMDYEGQESLFFDVQYGPAWGDTTVWAHQFYSLASFGNIDDTVQEVRLKVAVAGSIKDYDRPFQIEVVNDSTTAICPDEYEPIDCNRVIKAGANCTYITVTTKKTARMADETLQLQLRLLPNEHFTLPFSEIGNIAGRWKDVEIKYGQNIDPNVHNIFINNFLSKPKGWNDHQFGQFTPTKFALMLELTGWEKAYFDDVNKMQSGRIEMVQRMVISYLLEQYKKGREYWVLDEDGTMMWVRGLGKWAEGTSPDDMV